MGDDEKARSKFYHLLTEVKLPGHRPGLHFTRIIHEPRLPQIARRSA
jgi:hypothetical protein